MKVLKRNGQIVDYEPDKIKKAIFNCFLSVNHEFPDMITEHVFDNVVGELMQQDYDGRTDPFSVEEIQDLVEKSMMDEKEYDAAKAYILYRERHKEARFIKERIDYMNKYVNSDTNASTASETDSNANVAIKNVANLEGEVYKTTNRIIQRKRMVDKLKELYPEVANKYEEDLDSHIIYVHDEASTPTIKNYCEAVSLYPLLLEGTGNIDGVTPKAPQNLSAFCGQLVNLAFLLSSQCKGAVAFGGLFIAFNYYCVKEWGKDYFEYKDSFIYSDKVLKNKTIQDSIIQHFQQIIWGLNQPAGNRSYQSP